MSDPINIGIITLIEHLEENLRSLSAELPFFSDKPVDYDGIKHQFEAIMDQLSKVTEKTTYTHILVQSVINSIYSSRKELKDSVDGLLRKTGDQLGKITATTEAATNKILDEAMKLDSDQNTIIDKLDAIKELAGSDELNTSVEELKGMIYANQDSVFNIIQFLQFQDITAQQIKGAYSLLHDTEKTLIYVSNLLKEFELGDNELTLPLIDKNSFNATAVYANKANIQNAIDDLFSSGDVSVDIPRDAEGNPTDFSSGTDLSGGATEVFDIDALFGGGGGGGGASAPATDAGDLDIDALFSSGGGGGGSATEESTDAGELDIDAMFSQNNEEKKADEEAPSE